MSIDKDPSFRALVDAHRRTTELVFAAVAQINQGQGTGFVEHVLHEAQLTLGDLNEALSLLPGGAAAAGSPSTQPTDTGITAALTGEPGSAEPDKFDAVLNPQRAAAGTRGSGHGEGAGPRQSIADVLSGTADTGGSTGPGGSGAAGSGGSGTTGQGAAGSAGSGGSGPGTSASSTAA